ncbi:hypothetical protein AD998_10060 [bacterium 336/3]|nr:hypothetical protein AD998_10060 [bacterium 336/3]
MKPTKEILVSYLYGELDEQTAQEVATYLAQHPEEKVALEELNDVRVSLAHIPTKKPTKPLVISSFEKSTKKPSQPTLGLTNFSKNLFSMAASLAILIVAAYLTNFKVSQKANGFEISFGKSEGEIVKGNSLEMKDVEALLQKKMDEKDAYYQKEISALKNKANSNQNTMIANTDKDKFTKQEVVELIQRARKEDYNMMQQVFLANNQEQNEYLNKAFKAFAAYWEQKREQDLNQIDKTLATFKEQASEKFKENDMILTRLIDNQKQ